ncbi:MAG: Spy/CpxP family protein refolding chaperone [Candidatus Rokubacteria bacterium]|nr:Spy/CpxP family protein refolding chaperone [Candidatus Rokubacteria bacterium]
MRAIVMISLVLGLVGLAGGAWGEPAPVPVMHEEVGRLFDEMGEQVRGLGSHWHRHFRPGGSPEERPLISFMLHRRDELKLTPEQVQALEGLRADFQREAIRREADLRVAELDLRALLQVEPADLARVEAKVREIAQLQADLRVARIRVIEQGKAQLTPEQRTTLKTLLAAPRGGPRQAGMGQ